MNNYRRRRWHPTPVLLPGKSHGWRSLVGCHLWGRTESDTTEETEQQQHEQLHTNKSDNLEEMDQVHGVWERLKAGGEGDDRG